MVKICIHGTNMLKSLKIPKTVLVEVFAYNVHGHHGMRTSKYENVCRMYYFHLLRVFVMILCFTQFLRKWADDKKIYAIQEISAHPF